MTAIDLQTLSQSEYENLHKNVMMKMKKLLTKKRFEHTLNVEKTALELGKIYQADKRQLSIAALMHDNAKCFTNEKKLVLCEKYNIRLTEIEQQNIDLVHSKLGGAIAKEKYHISNIDVINAIIYHTTGRPGMTLTEKIIYISDFIEPGRKEFVGLVKARELAYTDIDAALIKILMLTINHLINSGGRIDPRTEETYEFYYKKYSAIHNQ